MCSHQRFYCIYNHVIAMFSIVSHTEKFDQETPLCQGDMLCRICILYGFPCEMDFVRILSESHPSHLRRGWDSEMSGEKSISHGKPYKMHFLAYFTLQDMLIRLNIRRKLKILMDLSHNCSEHGGKVGSMRIGNRTLL